VGEMIALYVGDDRRFVEFARAKEAMPRALVDHQADSRAKINVRLEIKKEQRSQVLGKQADINHRLDAEDIQKLGHRFISKDVLAAAEEDFLKAQEVAVAPRALPQAPATLVALANQDAVRAAKWAKMQAISTSE
jgi:hypothetical protein